MKNNLPKGVIIFSVLIIIGSLLGLKYLVFMPEHYKTVLSSKMSESVIFYRYIGSISVRLLTIAVAVGLLFNKEICRKFMILIALLTIIFIYWKHPSFILEEGAKEVAAACSSSGACNAQLKDFISGYLPWIMLVLLYIRDIGFSLAVIYYFTRPKIKERFK